MFSQRLRLSTTHSFSGITRYVELPYYRDYFSYKRLCAGNLWCDYSTQSLCKSILSGHNIVSRIIDTTVTTWNTIPPRCRFFPRNRQRTRSSLHTFAHGFPAGRDPGFGGALYGLHLQPCIVTTFKKTSWLLAILNRKFLQTCFPVSVGVCTVRSSDFKLFAYPRKNHKLKRITQTPWIQSKLKQSGV